MENSLNDDLMETPELPVIHEVFFQFDDDEPVQFALCVGGEFSLTLKAQMTDTPTVEFSDGKGKSFKMFLK
jgi:hypothetical protein